MGKGSRSSRTRAGPTLGRVPAYYLPPGTPPVLPVARPTGGGGGGGVAPRAPYWQPGPFKALRPADVVGTWIAASFGPLGMNKQIFTFLLVGDRLRGVVCGRCDNAYTMATLEHTLIVGDTLYFDIAHQDRGEIDPPIFDRSIAARVVQNEMIASILGTNVVDRSCQSARAAGRTDLYACRADCARRDKREQLRGHRRLGARHGLRHSAAAREDADPAKLRSLARLQAHPRAQNMARGLTSSPVLPGTFWRRDDHQELPTD